MQGFISPQTPSNVTVSPDVTWLNAPSNAELCMRNCGCYRGSGYPGGSGFNTNVTVSGQVTNQFGSPESNLTMEGTINGLLTVNTTDRTGRYAVSALRGSSVSVAPRLPQGVTATPPRYSFVNLQSNAPNRNFTLRGSLIMPF